MHNYIITVYITTVPLCNIHSYMFRHFRVVINQFTTNTLLSYAPSSNCSCWKYNYKIKMFRPSLYKLTNCCN